MLNLNGEFEGRLTVVKGWEIFIDLNSHTTHAISHMETYGKYPYKRGIGDELATNSDISSARINSGRANIHRHK